jgi:hypothetical protein
MGKKKKRKTAGKIAKRAGIYSNRGRKGGAIKEMKTINIVKK